MSILKKILSIPDNELKDDDHLHRKDISGEEFEQALLEMKEKFKNAKPVKKKKHDMAEATIKALRSLKE